MAHSSDSPEVPVIENGALRGGSTSPHAGSAALVVGGSTALVPGAIERDPVVVRTRVTCALLYFAARYVPVPFLDDVLRRQISAYMVKHSVSRAGLVVPSEQLAPLFERDQHWAIGCLWWMFKLPFKILLFPIRTIANVVFAVRHLGKDFAELLLLGEVVDRAVANGDIRAEGMASEDAQLARSRRYRRAFDRALADTDTALLWGIVGVAIGPVRGVLRAALRPLRALWNGRGEEAVTASPGMEARASAVEKVLSGPEIARFLAAFDARFEAALRDEL